MYINWVSETKKRSIAQVYNLIYYVQEPIVLYNDQVLLALLNLNLFKLYSKEFAKGLHSYFEARYSQVCNSLQPTLNDLLFVTLRMPLVFFTWWAMCRQGIDKWLVCPLHSMYKDVRSRVGVGDGFSEELIAVVIVHQGSALNRLLLIIELEAPSKEFHTGCPWELLYADDLVISA